MTEQRLEERITTGQILDVLSRKPTAWNRSYAFWNECKKNSKLEALCVGTCESGDIPISILLSSLGAGNLVSAAGGFAAGITLGSAYAYYHIKRDAKKYGVELSPKEVALAVLAAEVGCILGATGTTSGIGYITGEDYPLSTPEGKMILLASIPPAYLIGTSAMSYLSLLQKKEAGRMIAKKGALYDFMDLSHEELGVKTDDLILNSPNAGKVSLNQNVLTFHGTGSSLTIKEKELPTGYQKDFNPETHSLYLAQSPLARYFPDARKTLSSFVNGSLEKKGYSPNIVQNPFIHEISCSRA